MQYQTSHRQIIGTSLRWELLENAVGSLDLRHDDALGLGERIGVRLVANLLLGRFDRIGQQLGAADQVSRGHLLEPSAFTGGRPRVFANGVASDARHLADLHMRMSPRLGQRNREVEAFCLAQGFLTLTQG